MKKIFGIFVALFLGIVMMFSVVGCNVDTQKELQNTIDELQSQIEEMEDRLAEREEQIRERDEKIEQLENEIAEKTVGTFYTLREAYVNGWLTKADLMSIAYYHNGGRRYNEEIMNEDYEPAPKTPEVLSELTELKIKSTAAKDYREKHKDDAEDVVADDFTIIQYCGTYGDCVVTMMTKKYMLYMAEVWIDTVAGVNINYSDSNSIKIWREGKGKEDDSSYEIQDYVLKISADKQVYGIDEEIFIDIIFENRSGKDVEIAYYLLLYPESPTGEFPVIEQSHEMAKCIFKNGEIISGANRLGGCFPVGQHELKYRAGFYLGWETTEPMVVVYSNTVEFSVIE